MQDTREFYLFAIDSRWKAAFYNHDLARNNIDKA